MASHSGLWVMMRTFYVNSATEVLASGSTLNKISKRFMPQCGVVQLNVFPTQGDLSHNLFSNTEVTENMIENIVCINFAQNDANLMQCFTQFQCDDFIADSRFSGMDR